MAHSELGGLVLNTAIFPPHHKNCCQAVHGGGLDGYACKESVETHTGHSRRPRYSYLRQRSSIRRRGSRGKLNRKTVGDVLEVESHSGPCFSYYPSGYYGGHPIDIGFGRRGP